MKSAAAIALAIAPHLAWAFEPDLPPSARQLAYIETAPGKYDLPVGSFRDGVLPTESFRGNVTSRTWRIDGFLGSTWELGETLGSQLASEGFELIFHCQTEECGGFDFRFATLVLPPPDMFVDLADFRFLSARRETPTGPKAFGIIVSRTAAAAMVQIIAVSPADFETEQEAETTERSFDPKAEPPLTQQPKPEAKSSVTNISETLSDRGHVVLAGLSFETGSSKLKNEDFPDLTALAAWLMEDSTRRIALVGHTDSKGTLEKNIALSQARAKSVEAHLVENLGVPAKQVVAHGIGYLSPMSSNATEDGRNRNRRVEAVLLSSQ